MLPWKSALVKSEPVNEPPPRRSGFPGDGVVAILVREGVVEDGRRLL